MDINLLKSFIDKCESVIQNGDRFKAKNLFLEIQSVYEYEIPNLLTGTKSSEGMALYDWEDKNIYWLEDMPLLKNKLLNYLNKIEKRPYVNSNNTNIYLTNNNNNLYQNFNLMYDNIKKELNKINLSNKDLEEANNQLDILMEAIKTTHNSKTKWEKISNFFKWLANKSIEIAIAFSPLIIQSIQSLL